MREDATRTWPPAPDEEGVEIVVEDVAARSWLRRIAMTLASQYGTQSYRFVARRAGLDRTADTDPVSPTFPVGALEVPPSGVRGEAGWSDEMETAYADLERRLVDGGWRPAGRGEQWWSTRFTRPRT